MAGAFRGSCVLCGGAYVVVSEHRAIKNGHKCIACRRAYQRLWRTSKPLRSVLNHAARARGYRAKAGPGDVLKTWARRQVGWAIGRGLLIREACSGCGAVETQAHHEDYTRPLVVRWLCAVCHTAEHLESKAG